MNFTAKQLDEMEVLEEKVFATNHYKLIRFWEEDKVYPQFSEYKYIFYLVSKNQYCYTSAHNFDEYWEERNRMGNGKRWFDVKKSNVKTEYIRVRLSERDKAELFKQAELHQMNMSEYIIYLIRKNETK